MKDFSSMFMISFFFILFFFFHDIIFNDFLEINDFAFSFI